MILGKNVKIEPTARIQNPEKVSIGDHSYIDDFVKLEGTIEIGKRCHISEYTMIQGGAGVYIKDYVGVSAGCRIFSSTETHTTGKHMAGPRIPDNLREVFRAPVRLEKYSFLGLDVCVLPGVVVEEGAVIGSKALLLSNTIVPAYEVWVGVPAKKIGVRPRLCVPDPPEEW